LRTVLWAVRFPGLAHTQAQLQAAIRGLGLPGSVQVSLPERLEGDAVTVSLTVRSADELRAAAAALVQASDAPSCAELFATLQEAP
jgi:hypothetical protein